jgi:putative transposase
MRIIGDGHPFHIDARVLLPDHLHCNWTLPEGDADFSMRWSKIKRHVSQQCDDTVGCKTISDSRAKRHESGIWQRRFWEHQIRDDNDFERHVDYIHWNPVKHDLVARAGDWPYSTFHRFVQNGTYSLDWGLGQAHMLELATGE